MRRIQLDWKRVWLLLLGLGLAFLVAVGLAIYVMEAPPDDLKALVRFLLASSLPSLLSGYLIFMAGRRWLRSIRHKALLAYSLGLVIAFINVYVTSQLMFVSRHDFLLLGLLLIFAGILSASFGYLLAAGMTHSLYQLQKGVRQITAGQLSTRIELPEADELAEVAEAFNTMAAELEQAFERQKRLKQARRDLIAAVSHDLRTPLTSIRAMIEALADGVVTEPETVQRYYRTIQGQVESLSRLIDDLFELSQLDTGQIRLNLEPVNLNDLVSDVLETMQAQARARDVLLQGRFGEDLPLVPAETARIQRTLYNLVQNAIRHTPPNGSISIVTTRDPAGVRVDVVDTGEGISPTDLPYVFDQFYRGEKSRSRETGGAGLGLAIAKRIIEAHRGRLWVESRPDRGSRFTFVLPVDQPLVS